MRPATNHVLKYVNLILQLATKYLAVDALDVGTGVAGKSEAGGALLDNQEVATSRTKEVHLAPLFLEIEGKDHHSRRRYISN